MKAHSIRTRPLDPTVGSEQPVRNTFRAGSRQIETKPPAPPRSGFQKTLDKISTAADRFFNAVAPQGVRVTQKVKAAEHDSGKETRRLLRELAHPQGALTSEAIKKAFDRIESTAQPAILCLKVTFDTLLSKRLAIELASLDAREIKTLITQLKVIRAEGADPSVEAHLNCLAKALRKEAQHRAVHECAVALLPGLQKAISQAATQPQLAADTYDGLRAPALSIMGQYRLTAGLSGQSESLMARAVIAMALDAMLRRQAIPDKDLTQLVRVLPGEEQAWLTAPPFDHLSPQNIPLLKRLAIDAADLKMDKLTVDFMCEVDDVIDKSTIGGAASAPCLRHVIDAASHWSDLQKRRTAHAKDSDPRADKVLGELKERVATLRLDPSELDHLSDEELAVLPKALIKLGIAAGQTWLNEIADVVQARLNQGIKDCSDALLPALEHLHKGDMASALKALVTLKDVVSRVLAQHDVLRVRDQTGADDLRQFEYTTYDPLFQALEDALRERCLDILGSADTRRLSDLLRDMGSDLRNAALGDANDPRLAIGEQLVGIEEILTQLLDSVTRVSPPRSEQDKRVLAKPTLGFTSIRKTVHEVFQIPPQRASDAAHAEFQENLRAMKKEEPLRGHVDITGDGETHTGVHPSTWNDIGRATHYIESSDGSLTLLMSRDKFSADPVEKLRQRQEVVQRWEELADHDPIGLHNLADALNQRVMAGFAHAMASPQSPIRLPDGTPGSVSSDNSGDHTRATYIIRRGQQPGEWRIRIERELDQLVLFQDPVTSDVTELDPEHSYVRLSAELVVRADGQIEAPEPFSFDYHLVTKPAQPT